MRTPKLHTQSRPKFLHRPALSVRFDTLPARRPLTVTYSRHSVLITVRDGLTHGEIERLYQRLLPPLILNWVADAFEVSLSTLDRDRWWDPEQPADWDIIRCLEMTGRLTSWPHGQ